MSLNFKYNLLKVSNLKTILYFYKPPKNKLNSSLFKIVYLFLFYLTLFSLPNQILSVTNYYIEIKLNQIGEQQVISDSYPRPSLQDSTVNGISRSMNGKKIHIDSVNHKVKLFWRNPGLTDFSKMFHNLENITEVYIHYLHGQHSKFSYTFCNCINLEKMTIAADYSDSYAISDMSGMFYNCQSLASFSFDKFYLDIYSVKLNEYYIYYYNHIDMSNMFYNCINLRTIEMYYNTGRYANYISNMNYMFYNCISLSSVYLARFQTDDYINLSHMFYNCQKLETITFSSNSQSFGVNNIELMFYNCTNLKQINLISFKSSYDLNFSYLFYNCQNLKTVELNDNYLHIIDTREMFYNCYKLEKLTFYPQYTMNQINMSRMFYNCYKLNTITLIKIMIILFQLICPQCSIIAIL